MQFLIDKHSRQIEVSFAVFGKLTCKLVHIVPPYLFCAFHSLFRIAY